ncbi:hypothetical protein ANANG_G00112730 [Anguilla anguilla]|uniref:Uncharacterized protein n=1 Tax=Anguilla anguilla TaxID=7936 RepID=A0A9D3MKI3_ANGAN|nr:hypothetical protein ANANG_G00112730 [Anguilla anguilla]
MSPFCRKFCCFEAVLPVPVILCLRLFSLSQSSSVSGCSLCPIHPLSQAVLSVPVMN